jgi:hypothetical protein
MVPAMSDELLVFALIGVSALTLALGLFLLRRTARPKQTDDADGG